MNSRLVGTRSERREDAKLLSGRGRYVDDISLPGLLEAAFVRSTAGHGRILSVDVAAARTMPGVHAVLTYADLVAAGAGSRMPLPFPHPAAREGLTQYALAADEVCYVGEPIAIVVADDRQLAEDAASAVIVDVDPLPVAIGCVDAAKDDAPNVHSDRSSNVAAHLSVGFGDVDAVFDAAAHVFSDRVAMHRGGCHAMECRGVVAEYSRHDDHLTVWTSTQSPYLVRRILCQHLGRDEHVTRVLAPDVGGGFGPKANVYPEEIVVPIAAMALGRPVRWSEDRREHFVATLQQRDQIWEVEVAADERGRMTGLRGRAWHDAGAYLPYGVVLPLTALTALPGPYALDAVSVTMDVVHTNAVPTAPVRGAGRPCAAFVLERMADRIAQELDIDPAEVRRRSFVTAEQMPYATGMRYRDGSSVSYDSGDYAQCLEAAVERSGYAGFEDRRRAALADGRYLGIGIASYVEDTGVGPFEGATVRVERSGRVVLTTGAANQGQGHATMLSQICADALSVDLNSIRIESADTGRFPMGMGTIGSRIAVMAGSSVQQAATEVRMKALAVAADAFGVGTQALTIEGGFISVLGQPDQSISLGEIAARLFPTVGGVLPSDVSAGLEATSFFSNGGRIAYAYGTHVAEVEVILDTGEVRLLRYTVAHDCGRIINPAIVDGQIIGGVVHGIGNALFERMMHDDQGQPVNANYGEYLLPMACEIPPIDIVHIETPSPLNPLGAKGAGEGGTIPAAAAIIGAIERALPGTARLLHHPVGPEQLYALINLNSPLTSKISGVAAQLQSR